MPSSWDLLFVALAHADVTTTSYVHVFLGQWRYIQLKWWKRMMELYVIECIYNCIYPGSPTGKRRAALLATSTHMYSVQARKACIFSVTHHRCM